MEDREKSKLGLRTRAALKRMIEEGIDQQNDHENSMSIVDQTTLKIDQTIAEKYTEHNEQSSNMIELKELEPDSMIQ